MSTLKNKVPTFDARFLQASNIHHPFAFSAIEKLSPPLEENQLKEGVSAGYRIPATKKKPELTITGDNAVTGRDHFSLVLDHKTLTQQNAFHIIDCNHFTLRCELPEIHLKSKHKFFIEITNCTDFSIEGIACVAGRNMLFISDSSRFSVSKCSSSQAEGAGIIIYNGSHFEVSKCFFKDNLSAAILVIGNSFSARIHDCTCRGSRGFFNHDAGIHLCCTSENVTPADIPERCHEALPIDKKTNRPHHIIIENCHISCCRSQGIYLEGAVNCLLTGNTLMHNNKEGICFDWGSCYNIFKRNIVALNGKRANLSKQEIKVDFITEYPLLENGSSSMKLPGISLDNGCMNLIQSNTISTNYGGGIKMVRTALFNNIINNEILHNAIGANHFVPCFHGIAALGIGAIHNEFDTTRSTLLDFYPSIHNSIVGNTIIGHWQPIFSDKLSFNNYTSDNVFLDKDKSPLPSLRLMVKAICYLRRIVHKLPVLKK